MLIFILGYMGSGKTVTGRKIAGAFQYRFLDMDEMFELSGGYTVKDYFEKYGEESFRMKEREILISHLSDKDTVIATGGGTPCYEDNMELMNLHGITVFLDTPVEIILHRLSGKMHERPLLDRIPREKLPGFIREHLASRRIYYERARLMITGDEDLAQILKAHAGK